MKTRPILIHALSPVHSGVGQTSDIIDLPIARMKATGIPFIPGSSLKGVLRDARRLMDEEKTRAVFGPTDDPSEHAGALVVGDARLLALPVRSFRGTFAWVTSPMLLSLAKRDLEEPDLPIPSLQGTGAQVTANSACIHNDRIFLEDIDLQASASTEAAIWADRLAPLVSPKQDASGNTSQNDDIFTKRFVIVNDETMTFFWETATQVDARVRIDSETRTVAKSALWLEESLPPETLLIGLLAADRSRRRDVKLLPEEVLDFALSKEEVHQVGGKATIGRGRCRILPFPQNGVTNG